MSTQGKKRRTYWVADVVTPVLRDRALLLSQKGFEVQFFTTLDGLITELTTRRAAVIVVSDDGDEQVTEKILVALMGLPEIQGARLVMVRNTHSDRINFLAACANFRDIIPSNLDERLWLTRFIYATAGKPMQYVQPAGQITLNNISAVSLPARITWISETQLRLECRARPPTGATLNLGGALADAAGVATISLKVLETQRSHLLYRFSDAIIAEWSVPTSIRPKMLAALEDARANDPGPRCRVFIAAQTPELRASLLSRFGDPRFEVSTALQKQSIVDEPKFFTPDMVLIEDSLCLDEGGERFDQMMANLTDHATVVIFGRLPDFETLQKRHPGRRILNLVKVPKNLSQSIISRYLPQREAMPADGGANVMAEHPFSLGEVTFPARLHRIHPLAAQIAMPFPVGNFAMARLDSPLVRKMLGRNPYVKITATYQDTHPDAPPFIHLADCYLADLDQGERKAMVASLARLVSDNLSRLDPTGSFSGPQTKPGEVRTPELGSLRSEKALEMPPPARSVAAIAAAPRAPLRQVSGSDVIVAGLPEEDNSGLMPVEQIADLVRQAQKAPPPPPPVKKEPVVAPPAEDEEEEEPGWEEVRERVRVRRGVQTTKLSAQQIIIAVAAVAFVAALLWGLFAGLASYVPHSGGVYSDQLQKFAPHKQP